MRICAIGRMLIQHLFALGIAKVPPKQLFVWLQVPLRFNRDLVIGDTIKLYLNET